MPVRRHPVALRKPDASPARLPLDLNLVVRLTATYARLREHKTQLAELFYRKLFTAAPQLRAMFRETPAAQAAKLMAALDAVVRNFEHPDEGAAMIEELGRRHAAYGARPEHYDLVIELLIESMTELLGSASAQQDLDEWRMALRLISNQMIAAAAAQPPAPRANEP